MKRYLFLSIFLISIAHLAQAQVYPPNFQCVQNDTLRWDNVQNPCGAFQRFLIYGSQNKTGPYVQLASITDVNVNLFYHVHLPNQSWYYFMQSRHDCPGQPTINSDTLNGSSPATPLLHTVTIEGNKAQVEWQLSADKKVNGYIIYKVTPAGVKPIDTVFNDNKFRDLNSTPDKNRETYYVLALNRCGGTSIFGKPHQSIRAFVKQDECERQAILTWNKYKDWDATAKHEIWVKQGNLPYSKIDTVAGKDTTFIYKGLKDKEKYCFYIRSLQQGNPKIAAKTNEVCIVGNLVESTEFIIVKNIEINSKGEASFTWIWNNTADLDSIKIKRALDGKTFTDISSLSVKNYTIENTFADKTPIGGKDREYYGIYTSDICDNYAFAPFYTIDIKGKAEDSRSNTLNWTAHHLENNIDYELYRSAKGIDTKIWDSKDKFQFTDTFDPLNPDNAVLCYYVVAYAWDTFPNGKTIRVRSKSNTVCVSQTASIFTPNAFAPRGINQEFRPQISFNEQLESYSMQIFDRNGAKVFETKELSIGWNGKINNNGQEMQQDVYVYYIKATQKNGKINETKGTVMLLR